MNTRSRRTRHRGATLWVLLIAMSSACASNDDAEAGFGGLEGRVFFSQHVHVDGAPMALAPESKLTLSFAADGKEVSFRGGCNWMGGKARLTGGKLQLDDVFSTAMRCRGKMDQEAWYADIMTSGPSLLAEGATLTLVAGSTTIVYLDKEVATPDKKLTDGLWEVWQVCGPAVCHRGSDAVGTLRLKEDGSATLFDFCRKGTGHYTATEDAITFTDLAYQSAPCSSKGAQYDQDGWNAVVKANTPLAFVIDASRLVLKRGDGELRFNLAPN